MRYILGTSKKNPVGSSESGWAYYKINGHMCTDKEPTTQKQTEANEKRQLCRNIWSQRNRKIHELVYIQSDAHTQTYTETANTTDYKHRQFFPKLMDIH